MMKTMKKILPVLLCCFLALPMIGCSNKLPDWADEEQLTQQAQEILELVNAQKFDEVSALYDNGTVTGEQLESSLAGLLKDFGEFKDFGTTRCETVTENGVEYVRIHQVVNYQNRKVTYRVVFNEKGALAGLWL